MATLKSLGVNRSSFICIWCGLKIHNSTMKQLKAHGRDCAKNPRHALETKVERLEAENARLKEEQRALRKCKCGEPIFYQYYCERCRRQLEKCIGHVAPPRPISLELSKP